MSDVCIRKGPYYGGLHYREYTDILAGPKALFTAERCLYKTGVSKECLNYTLPFPYTREHQIRLSMMTELNPQRSK